MKNFLTVLCFSILSFQIYGQNQPRIDSLLIKLEKEKIDSVKTDILNDLSREYLFILDDIKSSEYAGQALTIATKAHYIKGMVLSYVNLIYGSSLDWVKGKALYDKAIELCRKSKNKQLEALVNYKTADYLFSLNQFNPELYAKKALDIYTELNDSGLMAKSWFKLAEINAFWNKSISKGNPELALNYTAKSLEIFKKKGNVKGIMDCYNSYIHIYKLYYSDTVNTLKYLNLATKEINHYVEQNPQNLSYKTQQHIIYFQWAMYYNELIDDYTKAESYMKKAIDLAERADVNQSKYSTNHERLESKYYHMGQFYLNKNEFTKADIYFKKFIGNLDQNNYSDLCSEIYRVEWLYRNKGMLSIAYEYINQAAKLAEKGKNFRQIWQANYYLADLYQLMDENETGINYYFQSYNLAKSSNHIVGQIVPLTKISNLYAKMNKLDSALYYNMQAEKLNETTINDAVLYVWILHNYAIIYEQQKEYQKALDLHLKVSGIRDNNNWNLTIETPYGYIATYSCMARLYLELKNYDKAFEYAQKSLKSFQMVEYPEIMRDDYLTLSKIYEIRNQSGLALDYFKKHIFARDEIMADQNQKKVQLIEIEKINNQKKAEIDKLSFQNQLKETKLKQQKILSYSFILGFVMVLALIIVVYRSSRQKSIANRLLKQNEIEILERNKKLQFLNEEITAQNDEIVAQNEEITTQNEQITVQRDILAKQKEEITDSIEYGSLIQQALFPTTEVLKNNFQEHFLLFKPRDIVSGDFYWFKQIENFIYVAVADGTGHGVPGAFMSTLGISLLNDSLKSNDIKSPEIILNELRDRIIDCMQQKGTNDGMDMALCLINTQTNQLQYSGANIPAYIMRDNELLKYNADRMPIGASANDNQPFTLQNIEIHRNDILYVFSDGYISQFGGDNQLKFSSKRVKETLLKIKDFNLETQKQVLDQTLKEWQGYLNQVDDILALGIKFA